QLLVDGAIEEEAQRDAIEGEDLGQRLPPTELHDGVEDAGGDAGLRREASRGGQHADLRWLAPPRTGEIILVLLPLLLPPRRRGSGRCRSRSSVFRSPTPPTQRGGRLTRRA